MLSDRTRRLLLPLGAFLAGLIGLAAAAVLTLAPERAPVATASVGGPFTLVSQDGRTVTERDFAGATHLVFFGFTHCPDICPTTLQQISDVLAALGDKARAMKVAFITVDPERDTPDSLKQYLGSFDPRIVGLTGNSDQVAAAVKAYRAYARKVPAKGDDYTMEHTALVYVMDGRNRFIGALNLQRPADETAAELAKRI
ncbi:SCO family protein [Methylobacterium planeticum]|uniref:SCO family protein n=1 Tax=Methylobacterium planeticum TaxID=2615211 RepID=A0A6N6MP68_9HYPH|nr:SCO family protein [Methylobacterium planeticum]KAB1071804.1 SCO family protein [Methylobacterium planeticum]